MSNDCKLEILIAALNKDIDIIKDMNIGNSNYVLANQCSENNVIYNENGIVINSKTRGVGINRNLALLYSSSKYILFADDDIEYVNNLEEEIYKAFQKCHKADVLVFNIYTKGADVNRRINHKVKKLNKYNCLNYGAVRIACKRERIMQKNIWFSTLFGGGAKYSHGEDSIFIMDCIRNKLKVYTYPIYIATVDQTESTWFKGYNEKYLFDQGLLIKKLFPKMHRLICLYFAFKIKCNKFGFFKKYKIMAKANYENK